LRDFHKLKVWEKAHQLTLAIYKGTIRFPKSELYGLTTQMRRAAVSIAANIAEGCGRGSDPEFRHYLRIALGSATELEYHLLLARDLELLSAADYEQLWRFLSEVRAMLTSLIRKLGARSS
jgi:four helix bundle protein